MPSHSSTQYSTHVATVSATYVPAVSTTDNTAQQAAYYSAFTSTFRIPKYSTDKATILPTIGSTVF